MDTFIRELVTLFGIKFQYYKNDDMAQSSIALQKEWEPHITQFVKLYHNEFPIQNLIDVGANFGYHTLLFSSIIQGNVYAFEPQLQNFQLLENNIKINDIQNVVAYNFACGDEQCDIKMPLITKNMEHVNMGDITPNVSIGDHHFTMTKSVLLDEMDFTSKEIDFIKIDVQGWEKKVLIGCQDILRTHKPLLIVEFEWFQLEKTGITCQELFDWIRHHDYYIFYLEYEYPSDHVCVHLDKLQEFRNKFDAYILPHNTENHINNNIECGVTEKIVVY